MYITYFCTLVLTYTESENGAENAIKLKRFCSVFQRLLWFLYAVCHIHACATSAQLSCGFYTQSITSSPG